MKLSNEKTHDILVIAFALILVLILYSLFCDTASVALISLVLFLIILAIMLM